MCYADGSFEEVRKMCINQERWNTLSWVYMVVKEGTPIKSAPYPGGQHICFVFFLLFSSAKIVAWIKYEVTKWRRIEINRCVCPMVKRFMHRFKGDCYRVCIMAYRIFLRFRYYLLMAV